MSFHLFDLDFFQVSFVFDDMTAVHYGKYNTKSRNLSKNEK